MKERGILFTAPMVRALLREKDPKTETRRLAVPNQPISAFSRFEMRRDPVYGSWVMGPAGLETVSFFQVAHGWVHKAWSPHRHGAPGDRLWVRETWQAIPRHENRLVVAYRASCPDDCFDFLDPLFGTAESIQVNRWRPALHMPRWASRVTLEITNIRIERLQEITDDGAIAEGVQKSKGGMWCGKPHAAHGFPRQFNTPREAFADLWDWINGESAPWASNPWVRVLQFVRVEAKELAA